MSNPTPSSSLFDLLTSLNQELSQIEKVVLEYDTNSAFLEAEIREEFREDFRRFVAYLVMPRAEFIAYWESDEQCQKAISKALNPTLVLLERIMLCTKAIVDYRSDSAS